MGVRTAQHLSGSRTPGSGVPQGGLDHVAARYAKQVVQNARVHLEARLVERVCKDAKAQSIRIERTPDKQATPLHSQGS